MTLSRLATTALLTYVCLAASLCSRRIEAQSPVAAQRFARGAVVSQSALASDVGRDVLRDGGNAIDAAVATALALAVTHPAAGNIGGGGFLVVVLPDGRKTSFDFREAAPLRATADMFLDENGEYDPAAHHASHRSVGVPGSVAGLHLAHTRLGRLPWKRLVEPAVRLAADGFIVSPGLADSLASALGGFRKHAATLAQFTRNGQRLRPGDRLVQADLARTLARIRDDGPEGFYGGETARLIEEEMVRGGGLICRDDLAGYRAVERVPVRGLYRGFEVIGMPPPSSGGIAVIELLNILEAYDLRALGFRSAPEIHLLVEAMRRIVRRPSSFSRRLGLRRRADRPARVEASRRATTCFDPSRARVEEHSESLRVARRKRRDDASQRRRLKSHGGVPHDDDSLALRCTLRCEGRGIPPQQPDGRLQPA